MSEDPVSSRFQKKLKAQRIETPSWGYADSGTRFKVFNTINGMLAYSVPMISQTYTRANDPRFNFRIWGEF